MLVLITGASAGFGAEIARRYVAEGHRVILTGRRADRLHALAGSLAPQAQVAAPTLKTGSAWSTPTSRA